MIDIMFAELIHYSPLPHWLYFLVTQITAKELLAFSRVQNQVAKSAVLAFKLPAEETDATCAGQANSDGSKTERTGNSAVGYIMINFRNVSDRV